MSPATSPSANGFDLASIAHVALDMDGTIYSGSTLFPCAKPFLELLGELGIGYSFLTNNPSKSVDDYVAHLNRMGLPTTGDKLYTSAKATIDHLRLRHPTAKRLFLLGTPSMELEFTRAGYVSTTEHPADEPDAVIVGFDLTLSYPRLCRAAWWINAGKPYLATNPDRICPTDQQTVLVDCGSICAALKEATGRDPDAVIGKPDPAMLSGLLARHSLKPKQVAMVGDRLYTDVLLAKQAQALGVLVLTGETTLAAAAKANPPADLVVPSLAEFGEMLRNARDITPSL